MMSNRKRSRAIRAAMTESGDNYTRAASRNSIVKMGSSESTPLRDHIRRVLTAYLVDDQDFARRVRELESSGYRMISGGQTLGENWEIHEWRTGKLIAEGSGGLDGYDATCEQLGPDGMWYDVDNVRNDLPYSEAGETPGIPPSLVPRLPTFARSVGEGGPG
jgi:hypothetical protein